MTIQEYRNMLFYELKDFDPEEVANVVNYYTELIQDSDNPEEQMSRLGTPGELADKIKRENGWTVRRETPAPISGGWTAGRVIALIFTSPLWLTVYILIISLGIVAASVFVVFPFTAANAVVSAAQNIPIYVPYSVELLFVAVLFAGITILLIRPAKLAFEGIGRLFVMFTNFLFRPGHKPEKRHEGKPVSTAAVISGVSAVVVGIVGASVMWCWNNMNIDKYNDKLELVDIVEDIQPDVKDIVLDIDIGAVEIKPTISDEPRIECLSVRESGLRISSEDKLSVNYDMSGEYSYININFNLHKRYHELSKAKFVLYLPEEELDSLNVTADLGTVDISGVNADSADIRCSCGNSSLEGCEFGSLIIENSLGEVNITDCTFSSSEVTADCGSINADDCEFSGSSQIICSLGEIKLLRSSFDVLACSNDCGDVEMRSCTVKESADIELDLGSADISLIGADYDVRTDVDLGEAKINGKKPTQAQTGSVRINVSCDNGDIDVNYS